MLQNTGLLSIKQVSFLNTVTLIYKIKEKLIPENILKNTRYITDAYNYPTRSREDFYISIVSSNYSQNDLFHNRLIKNSYNTDLQRKMYFIF